MKTIRTDYKIDRNQEIYDEYINSDTSFNKLAKKYELSPQRVQFIINDLKSKGLGKKLNKDASKEERENYKNLAVELREQGKLEISLKMLEQVIEWDTKNENFRGQHDVLGHIQIIYRKLSEQAKSKEAKLKNLQKAQDYLNKSLKLATEGKLPEGALALNNVSKATGLLHMSELVTDKEAEKLLKEALVAIDKGIALLPGSTAHKAWPLKTKALILHKLKKTDEALDTLRFAEKCLFEGYGDEMEWPKHRKDGGKQLVGNDQAIIKINAWLSMIHLAYAEIYKDTQRYILAKHYANSVNCISDPTGTLNSVKKAARKILEEL